MKEVLWGGLTWRVVKQFFVGVNGLWIFLRDVVRIISRGVFGHAAMYGGAWLSWLKQGYR